MDRVTPSNSILITEGVVRQNSFRLAMIMATNTASPDKITVNIRLYSGNEILHNVSRERFIRINSELFHVFVPIPEQIVSHVYISLADGSSICLDTSENARNYLTDLFPIDELNEIPESLKFGKTVRDYETLKFIVSQILSRDDRTVYTKLECVKKLSYMAMQTGTASDIVTSIEIITQALPQTKHLTENQYKKNPVHGYVSLIYIRALCFISVGNFQGALLDMEILLNARKQVKSVPLMGSNLSRILLIFGWVLGAAGDKTRAAAVFHSVVEVFRTMAANMPARRQSTFSHMQVPLRCASQAIGCSIALRNHGSTATGDINSLYMAREFSRLEVEEGQSRLATQLEHFVTYLEQNDPNAVWPFEIADITKDTSPQPT